MVNRLQRIISLSGWRLLCSVNQPPSILYPVLSIPVDVLDYGAHTCHLDLLIVKMEEKLTSKEGVVFEPGGGHRLSLGLSLSGWQAM